MTDGPDRQLGPAHDTTSAVVGSVRPAVAAAAAWRRACSASASAISAGPASARSSPPTSQAKLDHPPLRPTMGDDHRPPDAEQRRAADPLVVEDVADPVDAGRSST